MAMGWALPLGLGLLLSALLVGLRQRWRHRRAFYQRLAQNRAQDLQRYQPILVASTNQQKVVDESSTAHPLTSAESIDETVAARSTGPEAELYLSFKAEPLVYVHPFLSAASLACLQAEAEANRKYAERSYIPGHKQGGTLAYEHLHSLAPHCLAFYHADATQQWVSAVVGADVYPTCDHDQSSCSLLYYDREGDHIGWHFDHNFYKGRHFTVLLALHNTCAANGQLFGRLLYCGQDSQIRSLHTPPNMLVLLEGAYIRHCTTAVGPGDLRAMLSMTYSTDPRIGRIQEIGRRFKDVAYYGLRALWD